MQAYSKKNLYHKYIQEQAEEALNTLCISKESYVKILDAHPCILYTPNLFIKIALGLLTLVAVLFSGLLLWLISSASSTQGIIVLLIFLAIICYITLEVFIANKKYYNAGIDNVLLCLIVFFITSSFFISDAKESWLIISGVTMIISLWLSIRFTDAFMAIITYCCFFMFVFLLYLKAGNIAKLTAPLIMMIVSALVYIAMKNLIIVKSFIYRFSFKAACFLTLVTFYLSGNYFVVKELSNQMFHLQAGLNNTIPLGWLFWMFTFTVPFGYIFYGVLKKDSLLIRTGLGLIAATVFTVKYYYSILPAEIEMLIGGIILIAVSYALIRFLRTPKYGYTSDHLNTKKDGVNIEALIIAETFNKQIPNQSSGLYQGGSGGGGGATGEY